MTTQDDPFAQLGLVARTGLSDDEVHAAWRRIAAATHPDREDGGDPARFGAAAAAYVLLRTSFGRGEALADLGEAGLGAAGLGAAGLGASRLVGPGRGHPRGTRRSGAHRSGTQRRSVNQRSGTHRSTGQRPRGGSGLGGRGLGALVTSGRGLGALVTSGLGIGRFSTGRLGTGRLAGWLRVVRLGAPRAGRGTGAWPAARTLPVASATAVAAGTVVAAGLTPATIGLLTGALTVTGWALWRQGGWGQ